MHATGNHQLDNWRAPVRHNKTANYESSCCHEYGAPEVLKFEEYPDPVVGTGEVRVRVAATSINRFDIMRRSGVAKEVAPIKFPGVLV
jgi:NADPH:quinone reductase-like Zn-dependent oxidoreductase